MRSSDSKVRPARLADSAEIGRLAAELGYPTTPAEMEDRLRNVLAKTQHHVAVLDDGSGPLAGWVHVEHGSSLEGGERAELMGLVIDSSARRSGLGRYWLPTLKTGQSPLVWQN